LPMTQGATELRKQVYLRLRDAIDAGTFAPGARVPASRDQARVLGVSRNTVLWALERLHAEGYLVARVGDGTYVSERAITPPQPRHLDAAADRRRDEVGIGVDEFDDIGGARERVGIGMRKLKVRQPHRPVRKLKGEGVPALAAPALGDPCPLQYQMRKPALLEPVTHHEPGLAAADN